MQVFVSQPLPVFPLDSFSALRLADRAADEFGIMMLEA